MAEQEVDLESLSDAELAKIAGQDISLETRPEAEDLEDLSDKELLAIVAEGGSDSAVPTTTIEEMHPDLNELDRASMSLFLRGDQEIERRLKSQGFNIGKDDDGNFEIFKPGDEFKYRIDPDTGAFSSDIVGDVADFAREGVEFGAQTLATIPKIGAALAAPLTGGGSLPLGMAAGGVITGGADAALQGLGQVLGQRDEPINLGSVGISAVAGATIPGLGAAAKAGVGALRGGAGKASKFAGENFRKLMKDSPVNLAKALRTTNKQWNELRGETIDEVVGRLSKETSVYDGVLNNQELFENLKVARGSLGRALGGAYDEADRLAGKGFTLDEVLGSAGDILKKANGKTVPKVISDRAKKALKTVRQLFDREGSFSLAEMRELKTGYDGLINYGANTTADVLDNKVNKMIADVFRDFSVGKVDNLIAEGALSDGTIEALKASVKNGSRESLSGLFKKANRTFGDIVDIETVVSGSLADANRKAGTSAVFSPFSGIPEFTTLAATLGTFSGPVRYLRHQIANGKLVEEVAAPRIQQLASKVLPKQLPRSVDAFRAAGDSAVAFLYNSAPYKDFAARAATGSGILELLQQGVAEGLSPEEATEKAEEAIDLTSHKILDQIFEGPPAVAERAVSQLTSILPDAFESSKSGYPSEVNGKILDPVEREEYSFAIKDDLVLSMTEKARMRSALNKNGLILDVEKFKPNSSLKAKKQTGLER